MTFFVHLPVTVVYNLSVREREKRGGGGWLGVRRYFPLQKTLYEHNIEYGLEYRILYRYRYKFSIFMYAMKGNTAKKL